MADSLSVGDTITYFPFNIPHHMGLIETATITDTGDGETSIKLSNGDVVYNKSHLIRKTSPRLIATLDREWNHLSFFKITPSRIQTPGMKQNSILFYLS